MKRIPKEPEFLGRSCDVRNADFEKHKMCIQWHSHLVLPGVGDTREAASWRVM